MIDNRIDEDDELWDDELTLDDKNTDSDFRDDYYSETPEEPEDPAPSYEYDSEPRDYDRESPESQEEHDYYSDPEPSEQTPRKSVRERIFGNDEEEEDSGHDYYDSDAPEPVVVPKPKTPRLDPEDPDYWMEEESTIDRIIPRTSNKWKWWLGAVVILIASICVAWALFMRPYVDGATKYGYIKSMERRGSLMKTFEGVMIPYKELGDPNPLRFEELRFSVESDSLATLMKRMMLDCVPVRVEYESYRMPQFWKGEATVIIVKADTADPKKILPPEYRGRL